MNQSALKRVYIANMRTLQTCLHCKPAYIANLRTLWTWITIIPQGMASDFSESHESHESYDVPEFSVIPSSTFEKIGYQTILDETLRLVYTASGKEQIEQTRIETDGARIDHLLQLSGEWLRCVETNPSIPLRPLDDIYPILRSCTASGSLLPPADFLTIAEHAKVARLLLAYFERSDPPVSALARYTGRLQPLRNLEKEIASKIDENATVRDDASPELKKIRTRLNREESRLRSTMQRMMKRHRDAGRTSDEGITLRNGRMVIPVQAEFKRKIDGFVHDVSSSGQTVYIEPVEALPIHNAIRQLESEQKREIERILRLLTDTVRAFRPALTSNNDQLGILDAAHARAMMGRKLGGILPEHTEKGEIRLNQAKNPILMLREGSDQVVPLDLALSPIEKALIITGPNAGGKSVAMKTIGLLHLMMQSGYPVPVADGSVLSTLSGLFLDLGDEQSIESDLSTFSSRLEWMKQTLTTATPGALLLIDEAGAGTDPEEGGALFQAFIEEMIRRNCRVIATTHHGSLKVFAHDHPNVVNGAMEFDQAHLSPTYRFRKGVPGSSYAFEIAGRLKLPESLIKRARDLLGEQRDKMGELLLALEASIQESNRVRQEADRLKSKSDEEIERVRAGMEETERKRQAILRKAYTQADQIMKTANKRIEEAVEKIMKAGQMGEHGEAGDQQMIRDAREQIQQTKQIIRQKKAEMEVRTQAGIKAEDVSVGDWVSIGEEGLPGEILELRGNQVTILVNGIKIKSSLSKLKPAKKQKGKQASTSKKQANQTGLIDFQVSVRLDVRGKRGEEAIRELSGYLDRAIAAGLKSVEIIHGIGEGILMKLVREYLAGRKEVSRFESAPSDQGGAGKTIVWL